MILYIVLMLLATVLLACIIPIMQYLNACWKVSGIKGEYFYFSQDLFDSDIGKTSAYNDSFVNRQELANRGWVRCPKGTIMHELDLEEKKLIEYQIELP